MAGDILSLRTDTDGWQLITELDFGSTGGTYNVGSGSGQSLDVDADWASTAKISVSVTSPGYDSTGTATTVENMYLLIYTGNIKTDVFLTANGARIGNWPKVYGVGDYGLIGDTDSFLPEFEGRKTNRSPVYTFTDDQSTSGGGGGNGDYTATGDNENIVPAGGATMGWDLFGTAYRNDGTDSAGAINRVIASSGGSSSSSNSTSSGSTLSLVRTAGSYGLYGRSTVSGSTVIANLDSGSYSEIGQDTVVGNTHTTNRTTGSYGVYGAQDVVSGNTVISSRTTGSYGSGTKASVTESTRGAIVISDRTADSYGAK